LLILQQALVTAAGVHERDPRYADCQAFITAVAGIMFLGTPHNGSTAANVGLAQANFSNWLGQAPNMEILKPLVVDSTLDVLPKLERSFQKMLEYNDRLSKVQAAYFYETEPAKLGVSYPFPAFLEKKEKKRRGKLTYWLIHSLLKQQKWVLASSTVPCHSDLCL